MTTPPPAEPPIEQQNRVSPFAGKPADPSRLVNLPRLVAAYYTDRPDPEVPAQRVSFGTSVIAHLQTLQEAVNLSFSVNDTLFTRIKRMAGRANVGTDFRDSRASLPCVATRTDHIGIRIPLGV